MSFLVKKPIITEKTHLLSEANTYLFKVDKKANKQTLKKELEKMFDVKVESIRVCIGRGRSRKTKSGLKKAKYYKKAYIRLKKGSKINLFEGV